MIGALVAGITGSGGATLSSYESIATASGTGSSGTITFSSIPSTFKHLQIRGLVRGDNSAVTIGNLQTTLNSDSGSNYARHYLSGDGSTTAAGGSASATFGLHYGGLTGANAGSNTMGTVIIDILDYGSTSKNKTIRSFSGADNNGTGTVAINSMLWMSTNAVTSVSLTVSGNFTTATTFALYGIKEA